MAVGSILWALGKLFGAGDGKPAPAAATAAAEAAVGLCGCAVALAPCFNPQDVGNTVT